MGIQFGEVNSVQIIDNEFRSKFSLKIIEWIINRLPPDQRPTQQILEQLRQEVLQELQEKYPKSGLRL